MDSQTKYPWCPMSKARRWNSKVLSLGTWLGQLQMLSHLLINHKSTHLWESGDILTTTKNNSSYMECVLLLHSMCSRWWQWRPTKQLAILTTSLVFSYYKACVLVGGNDGPRHSFLFFVSFTFNFLFNFFFYEGLKFVLIFFPDGLPAGRKRVRRP